MEDWRDKDKWADISCSEGRHLHHGLPMSDASFWSGAYCAASALSCPILCSLTKCGITEWRNDGLSWGKGLAEIEMPFPSETAGIAGFFFSSDSLFFFLLAVAIQCCCLFFSQKIGACFFFFFSKWCVPTFYFHRCWTMCVESWLFCICDVNMCCLPLRRLKDRAGLSTRSSAFSLPLVCGVYTCRWSPSWTE